MGHRHRSRGATRDRCWTTCVAADMDCDGRPHGGVVTTETCACGATRATEITMYAQARGSWLLPSRAEGLAELEAD